ncbi:MAG: lipid-A-disaccharide synthase [Candidatus Cloacimonadaceae bacterium]|nr:lipid-A-disaccharide synthase [Candidatus Cloacimonadaceae bacterium]
MKKIFWLIGENSGDLHASMVMKRLNQDYRDLHHYGIGGSRMQAEGLKAIYPFDRFSVMVFLEVIKHLAFFLKVEKRIKRLFQNDRPDIVILVDYPGLNLRIARHADDERIPVLYYIAPQFWAWKHGRVFKLKDFTRHVACILPFEHEMLQIHNINSSYVGHPIAEEVSFELDRDSFARFYGLDASKKWIGFFPGSRNTEVSRMLPVFLQTQKLWNKASYEFLYSKARTISQQRFQDLIDESGTASIKIIDGYTYEMMKYCDLLIVTSGTATLEAAYIGTPMIIVYRTSKVSFAIGKRLVRVKRIGLPNIVLDESVVPELIQEDVNPQNLIRQAEAILSDDLRYREIRESLGKIKAIFGEKKASYQVVKIIKELLKL